MAKVTVTQSLDKTARRLEGAGSDIWSGVKSAFQKREVVEGAKDVAEVAAKPGLGTRMIAGTGRGIWHMASRPLVWGSELIGAGASKIGAGFKSHPRLMLGATVAAGGLYVGHKMNQRSERDAMDRVNELEIAQMRAAQAQAQANTVTPAEYAAMEARMRQGGQNGGFAANVQAERAAAASSTPAV